MASEKTQPKVSFLNLTSMTVGFVIVGWYFAQSWSGTATSTSYGLRPVAVVVACFTVVVTTSRVRSSTMTIYKARRQNQQGKKDSGYRCCFHGSSYSKRFCQVDLAETT